MRQETAVRLHARLYPGGEGPSKVRLIRPRHRTQLIPGSVLAQLHKEKVHGKEPLDEDDGELYIVS